MVTPRIGSIRHPDVSTLGPFVTRMADQMGVEMYEWQRNLSDISLEMHEAEAGRRLTSSMVGVLVGRQSGKTTWTVWRIAFQCLAPSIQGLDEVIGHQIIPQHVGFTAQDRVSAVDRWSEHVRMMLDIPAIDAQIHHVEKRNGHESVHFRNGSTYRIFTPNRKGARGQSLDLAVIDEAFAHPAWLMQAVRPTMAQRAGMSGCFGPQLIITSNAGDEKSELLNIQRELGRRAVAEDDPSRVWIEYSAADDDDPLDEDVWRRTIPTLDVPNGIPLEFLRVEAETMGTAAFAREYLCRTDLSASHVLIDMGKWEALPMAELRPTDDVVIAVECAPDRSMACIVAAGRTRGFTAIEMVRERAGVVWLLDEVKELTAKHGVRVVIDRFGPAANIIPGLKTAGVRVVEYTTRDMADAAAYMVDAVAAGTLAHSHETEFRHAVAVLARRMRGDRWIFDRHAGNVGPIVAGSMAAHVMDSRKARVPAIR